MNILTVKATINKLEMLNILKEKRVSCRVMGNIIYPTCTGREELEGTATFLRKLKKIQGRKTVLGSEGRNASRYCPPERGLW